MVPAPGETPSGEEVVALRTATSRTYETTLPGVLITQQHSEQVNVDTGEGWAPIDPTLEPSDSGFENTLDRVEVSIAASADDAELAEVELPSGASVAFGLHGAGPVEADVDGDTAVYEDALDDVDVTLQAVAGGLKETLVLGSVDAPNEFVFDLDLEGLTARLEPDGSVALVNVAGNPKLVVPPGYMIDAAGASSTAVSYALSPDAQSLVVTAESDWISASDRVFPIEVDPTLSVVADTDDTYVTQGANPAVNQSTSPVLKVGFDGSHLHRSFLKFSGLAGYEGMNILAADLALWESGAGSCTATPVDIHGVTQTWNGTQLTDWPGPSLDPSASATITSGKGHGPSCPAGAVGTDVTRLVDAWASGSADYYGIALRARDETAAAQFKTFVSADGDGVAGHKPILNVLWSDPTQPGAPHDPSGLAPEGTTTSFNPVLEATYLDPDDDDGFVVFFVYFAPSGAFLGAVLSPVVNSGETAAASGYLPLDLPLTWRAQAVDDANLLPSYLTRHVELVHPSVRVTAPEAGEVTEGMVSFAAELDPSITDATGVTFAVDSTPVGTATSASHEIDVESHDLADGDHDVTATISGGTHAGRASAPVPIYVDNLDGGPEAASSAPRGPTLRRTLGVIDDDNGDPRPPIDSGGGDCGWSEPLPDGNTLWLVCDRTVDGLLIDSVAGLAPPGDPTNPVFRLGRFLPARPQSECLIEYPTGTFNQFRPVRWMTGVASYPVPPISGSGPPDTLVVIFFLQACQQQLFYGPRHPLHDPGTAGIATYRYVQDTPASVPDGSGGQVSPLGQAIVRNDELWLGRAGEHLNPMRDYQIMHGTGAVYVPPGDGETIGYLYAYGCKAANLNVHIPAFGRCNIARTPTPTSSSNIAQLGTRNLWTYWNGSDWTSCEGTCTPTQLEAALNTQQAIRLPNPDFQVGQPPGTCPDGYPRPCPDGYRVSQHFEVAYSAQLDAYVAPHLVVFDQRHMSMIIRVADNPVGPWSDPFDVPIDCDGRSRNNLQGNGPFYNCYQLAPHPQLTTETATNTTFGYYDHFKGSFTDANPNRDDQDLAIRFVNVPVCVRRSASEPIGYVRGRCLMTGPPLPTTLWSVPLGRLEAAAIMWRLGGFRTRPVDPATEDLIPRRYRESASYILNSRRQFHTIWSTAAQIDSADPTTRGQLIRLLWRHKSSPSGDYPINTLTDYSTAWGGTLQDAVEWAYDAGVVCGSAFDPYGDATRSVAAEWVQRVHDQIRCDD